MDHLHIYDLTFVPSGRGKKAAFVFSVRTEEMPELVRRLEQILLRGGVDPATYFGKYVPFAFGDPDLFGNVEFGFGGCGTLSLEDGTTHLRIEFAGGDALYLATQTMHVLFYALSSVLGEGVNSNRLQLLDITTYCEKGKPYGHAIAGHVSSTIFRTLVERAALAKKELELPQSVIRAMKNAWRAAGGDPQFQNACGGLISEDGRFVLGCMGNACDVAIYPDQVYDTSGVHGAGLSCHNLDTATQQVTLLAGLATLAQAVEQEDW